jgi:hypothetical protein
MNIICRKENEGRKPDKNSSLRSLEFIETSTKMPFKNSIWYMYDVDLYILIS